MKGALVVLAALAAIVGMAWWRVDVAATSPHAAFVEEFLHETVEHAVRRSAAQIVPPSLAAAALVADGAHHYFPMCEGCHAGPGIEASEIAQGLYPAPPALHEEEEWSDAELFWITKNGIKASGMPAFGPTHSDDDLWAIVAFVRTLPEMDSATYEAFRPEATDADPTGRGAHAHGDGDHELGEDSGPEDHSGHAH